MQAVMQTCVAEPPHPQPVTPTPAEMLLVEPRGQDTGCQGRRSVSCRQGMLRGGAPVAFRAFHPGRRTVAAVPHSGTNSEVTRHAQRSLS